MEFFKTNDGCNIAYQDVGSKSLPVLILLHGFTGSSEVFQQNIPALSKRFRVVAPDLRGHGASEKPPHGFHVFRLAMDLHNLLGHLKVSQPDTVKCIAGSLGCSILWSYAELFGTGVFSHMIWIDQAPMQNYASDGSWGSAEGNRGMNSAAAVANLKATLKYDPDSVYKGTIAGCLGYRNHPVEGESISDETRTADEEFFLAIARKGNPEWYGNLMADHTALDWRQSIVETFGKAESKTNVLVVATNRSGCFPAAGPMAAVSFANSKAEIPRARGVVIEWGGHWCYWEDSVRFNQLALDFLL
ncbi:alpha/beta-hydrolase [Aureobasidium pullulans EXF-150]|uniref:Alpha/beta-hydrolase n=1 Tax=Aureobasidium pullulans EXF-150 TaxID=1043002 RepID=A0A074X923_AURPU|nr:alpha/beta-hydrolase [Aureobasidium pullulans EXF-150]KEQ81868.1 alpha/beta-hydrolase [Aureobasidium pullulans EXF-150]